MPPHCRGPRPSERELENAFHPYEKLVIGLPTAMEGWRRAYGTARDWYSLSPNPLLDPPANLLGDKRGNDHNRSQALPSRFISVQVGVAAARPLLPNAPRTNEPHFPHPSAVPPAAGDDALYCDVCQRDFATREKYEAHMDTHMYCTVPGCRFTCRKGKSWRMEEHMELLHNRPDAPNLVDTNAYLEQRRRRFPTQDAVKMKVEELYYKAARGVVLPDERRRWMQQHGIVIRKRPRSDASVIIRGGLPAGSRSPSVASAVSVPPSRSSSGSPCSSSRSSSEHHHKRSPQRNLRGPLQPQTQSSASDVEGGKARFIQPPSVTSYQGPDPTVVSIQASTKFSQGPPAEDESTDAVDPLATALPLAKQSSPSSASAAGGHSARAHPPKIIPLGPNGTLTPRQRVQLVRERYAAAKDVPQFYVCHRCGIKGEHWVSDCPTKGDNTYDRHVVWGEAKLSAVEKTSKPYRERAEKVQNELDQRVSSDALRPEEPEARAPNDSGVEKAITEQVHGSAPTQPSPSELLRSPPVAPQEEASANATLQSDVHTTIAFDTPKDQTSEDMPPVPQSAAPPADAPKEVTRMMAPVAAARHAQPHRREPPRRPPPPPTLYERLTEEAKIDEQGVLLQALRFFVARDFFEGCSKP
ncbi:hypothetical protein, conserved [Leishmania tarentolae]|uniref:C2H2-type domain-containing protein n=1 Tax=Leishmania tarentolae TaxID=5689 RepID=A0A640KM39_LEITA|nr:hypothetical protein, conserved [Leishmania tarentolae]